MQQYLQNSFAGAKLLAELAGESAEFYFVKQSGRVIGYLKINTATAQTELQDSEALEIERIYVFAGIPRQTGTPVTVQESC